MEGIRCDNGQLILDEIINENYVPTEEEIHEYAIDILEIDPDKESHLLWIAKEGLCANLPKDWKPCQDLNGDLYYFNFATGESTWEHPCDEFYRNMAQSEREKAAKKGGKKGGGGKKKGKQDVEIEEKLVARLSVKSPAFGRKAIDIAGHQDPSDTNPPETDFSLGGTLHMQLGDIGYEESEASDTGAPQTPSNFCQTPGPDNFMDSTGTRNITVNMPKNSQGILKSADARGDLASEVKSVGSSEEEEESDEVDFKDDQSLSDKLIASTDRLRFSPDACVNASLVSPPKTPRSSINRSPRKIVNMSSPSPRASTGAGSKPQNAGHESPFVTARTEAPIQELTSETPPSSAPAEETSSTGTKNSKLGAVDGHGGSAVKNLTGDDSGRKERATLAAMAAQRRFFDAQTTDVSTDVDIGAVVAPVGSGSTADNKLYSDVNALSKQVKDKLQQDLKLEEEAWKQKTSREAEERIVALQKEIEQMKAEEQRKVEQERDECVRQLRQKFPEKYEEEKARILAEEQPKLESLTKQMKEEFNEKLRRLEQDLKEDYERNEKRLVDKYDGMLKEKENELKDHQKIGEEKIERERGKILTEHKTEMNQIRLKYSQERDEYEEKFEQEKEKLKEHLERELDELSQKYEAQIDVKEEAFKQKLESLQDDHVEQVETEKRRLKSEFLLKKSEIEKSFAKQIEKIKQEIETKECEISEKKTKVREDSKVLDEEIQAMEKKRQKLTDDAAKIVSDSGNEVNQGGKSEMRTTEVAHKSTQTEAEEKLNGVGGSASILTSSKKFEQFQADEILEDLFESDFDSGSFMEEEEEYIARVGPWSLQTGPVGVPSKTVDVSSKEENKFKERGKEKRKSSFKMPQHSVDVTKFEEDEFSSGFSSTDDILAAAGVNESNVVGASMESTNERLRALMNSLHSRPAPQKPALKPQEGKKRAQSKSPGRTRAMHKGREVSPETRKTFRDDDVKYETAEEMMARKWKLYFGHNNPSRAYCADEFARPMGYGYIPATELLKRYRQERSVGMETGEAIGGLISADSGYEAAANHHKSSLSQLNYPYLNNWMPPPGSVESQLQRLNKWLVQFRQTMTPEPSLEIDSALSNFATAGDS